MTDKKFTDEEIIKSLDVCNKGALVGICGKCSFFSDHRCLYKLRVEALGLINRQKAEIERLQKEANLVSIQFQDLQERTKDIKSEAYKEFAEKLQAFCKEIIAHKWNETVAPISWSYAYDNFIDDIDNLLKEMTGDE